MTSRFNNANLPKFNELSTAHLEEIHIVVSVYKLN